MSDLWIINLLYEVICYLINYDSCEIKKFHINRDIHK